MPKLFHNWKIGTINIRTGKDDEKIERVVKEIDKAGLIICGLQEVRRLTKGSAILETESKNKYEIYWSGYQTKRQHGVGIVIKCDPNIDVLDVAQVNPRLIVVDVNVYGCCLRIVNCYAPTEESTNSAKNAFYCQLRKQFQTQDPKRKVLCIGDFNATSSACLFNSSLREGKIIEDLTVNDNGSRFHDFMNTQKLSVLNTWFDHKLTRRYTWHSPDGKTKKVYDFVLSCSWLRKFTSNCRVYNSYDFDTDHRLVIATLNTPITKVARFIGRKKTVIMKRIDFSAINDESESIFFDTVTENLSDYDFTTASNDDLTEKLISTIKNSAETTLPKRDRIRKTVPWNNDEKLKKLFQSKDELMSKNGDQKLLSAIRKKIRQRVRFLKNEYYKQEAENINQLAINREIVVLSS